MNTDRAVRIHALLFAMLRQYEVSSTTCLVMAMDIDKDLTVATRDGVSPYLPIVNTIMHQQINVLPYVPDVVTCCVLEYERQREGRKLVGS